MSSNTWPLALIHLFNKIDDSLFLQIQQIEKPYELQLVEETKSNHRVQEDGFSC